MAEESARHKARRLSHFNMMAICLSLFVPWILFCCMYWVMSFSMHYKDKLLCWVLVLMGLVFVAAIVKLAFDAATKERGDNRSDPSWLVFLAAACFLAWLSGVGLGDLNYFYHLEPYYELLNLNSYNGVDPSNTHGNQLMDAGRITFASGSRLDLRKAVAFKNGDTYCAAPVVSNLTSEHASYDFWAVGLNCCSGPDDFSCGEFNNRHAISGLRAMRDYQNGFYTLAVHQAVASYDIKADHPLFLYWMQDPMNELGAYQDEGYKFFLLGVFTSFAVMFFLVITAVVVFSKMS